MPPVVKPLAERAVSAATPVVKAGAGQDACQFHSRFMTALKAGHALSEIFAEGADTTNLAAGLRRVTRAGSRNRSRILMLASDALLGLKKHGIDPSTALQAINGSSGRSLQTQERIPKDVLTGKYNYGFKLNLMSKDVLNAADILKDGLFLMAWHTY